jgi:Mg2+ and Co2+ transporter CorA
MHAPGTPLENDPNAFWLIVGTMGIIGIIITIFLAKKRWI